MKMFKNIAEYNKHWGFPAPLSNDFDIQAIATVNEVYAPMRSSSQPFYSVGLYQDLDIEIKNGYSKYRPRSPFIFVKVPHQIFSWQVRRGPVNGWILMFTESFLIRHKALNTVVQDFAWLRADHSGPFEIDEEVVHALHQLFSAIDGEYKSQSGDHSQMIASLLYTLLLSINRLYPAGSTRTEITRLNESDNILFERFLSMVAKSNPHSGSEAATVSYFAEKLSVHPNYLSSVVKGISGYSALHFIHERILNVAKAFLVQSNLSIKEISYELSFNEPTHFGAFFKKYIGLTPAQFRRRLKV